MNARLKILLLTAAPFLWAAPLSAAKLSSPSFADPNGVYGFGSAAMVSANFESDGNVQEVAVSTQECASFSHRSGKLSFFPAPAPVSDLSVIIVSSSGLRLTWTAPYADMRRQTGSAEDYILRYSTSGHISTDDQFKAASLFTETWTPLEAGSPETKVIEGFNAGTTYYFALETINEHALRSELSNQVASFALVPLAPMNFQVTRAGNSITMSWIPPAGFQNRIPFNDRFSPAYPYEIRKYAVYRATAPAAADWDFIGETSSSTLNWTDIIGGSDVYYYHARAINQAGESTPSYARGSAADGGLYFLAPDNQSLFAVPAAAGGAFYSASGDPMDSYTLEISSHPEDLGGRVMKSVEFSAYRGGIQADTSFKLPASGTLKLYYAKTGGAITPSASGDAKALSMYYHNGSRWLQLYGKVNDAERSVQLETSLLGRYQLRSTERSGSFAADRAGLQNRLITPNGDGKNDTMVFIFDNPQEKQVKGRIYDLRGAQVASMGPGPVANSLAWDAKAGGQVVPGGVYIYQLEADGTVYNGTIVVIK